MQTDKTFRVRIPQEAGSLQRFIAALSSTNASIGDITTLYIGRRYTHRSVTVEFSSEEHFSTVLKAVSNLPGIILDEVVDEVIQRHEGGKLLIRGKATIRTLGELREVYTPGVAKVCLALSHDPSLVRKYTMAGNTVAVVSNGTRVLGLGNIGPAASLPVMEAKAMFYGQFVDLNAVPIVLDETDPTRFVETVVRLAPGFAGIHLEDIRSPDCMEIEAALIRRLSIPVMHDDQHGTAVVALAAILNMLKLTDRKPKECTLAQIGLGAAGLAIARLAMDAGIGVVVGHDPIECARRMAAERGVRTVDLDSALRVADVLCLATGRAGVLTPSMIRPGQLILALSNPSPEIEPEDALRSGAAIALDGRHVNNILCYPGLFKGAIEARVSSITTPMKLAAAMTIASRADRGEVLPDPLDELVHLGVAAAVEAVAGSETETSEGSASP